MGEQMWCIAHGFSASHRLFPPSQCLYVRVVSLGQQIIRFKTQGGQREERWRGKKSFVQRGNGCEGWGGVGGSYRQREF